MSSPVAVVFTVRIAGRPVIASVEGVVGAVAAATGGAKKVETILR